MSQRQPLTATYTRPHRWTRRFLALLSIGWQKQGLSGCQPHSQWEPASSSPSTPWIGEPAGPSEEEANPIGLIPKGCVYLTLLWCTTTHNTRNMKMREAPDRAEVQTEKPPQDSHLGGIEPQSSTLGGLKGSLVC